MTQQIIAILLIVLAVGAGSFVGGWKMNARQRRRAALRNQKDGNKTLQLAFQQAEDGAMEIIIPNNSMKTLKRGGHIEGLLAGSRGNMKFRVKALA